MLVTCITPGYQHSIPEWITPQTDAYLARPKVKENLVRSARPEQIFVTGIPVRQQFLGEVPKRDKRSERYS